MFLNWTLRDWFTNISKVRIPKTAVRISIEKIKDKEKFAKRNALTIGLMTMMAD
jgi:hypothetical protein